MGESAPLIRKFYVGDLIVDSILNKNATQIAFEKGYCDLRSKLIAAGMFKSSKAYYAYKCSSNMLMWLCALAMVAFSDSMKIHIMSANVDSWFMIFFIIKCLLSVSIAISSVYSGVI